MSLNELHGTFVLDPAHTTLSFVTRHAMVTKVRGSFEKFEGQAVINADDVKASTLEVTIDAASINTRNADRDGHIRSADFFDVENYPTWTFKGTDFSIEGDTVNVTGDLTIKDVTKSITIPLEYQGSALDPFGNTRVGFEGSKQIQRSDFGLTWNAALETGGFLVSDKVVLEFEISAIKQA
ncbi:YceI family protein [Tessaracoccus sp. MC1865]|uniref:YceI family protein n=1 Tax=unclassified Tessaracoccus TaxID=2635419 RepID=UPI00160372FE|nr:MULTISPECIES: YceI family protein [unclassified Tessaracoccus]MBB1482673.1 YceI family protein [Tessaracoccus sp. MC1865]MBB1509865.1 YceI family protein [Tessaracoccus sp. MC1756]QTO37878.1 YceI family protein [Tessaracoccus sp. MC1865]